MKNSKRNTQIRSYLLLLVNYGERTLNILIGEKLSSVTFVMDYLQVDFDGNQFTFYIWPVVTVDNTRYKFGDVSYRDKLCSLISKVIRAVTIFDNEMLELISIKTTNYIYT